MSKSNYLVWLFSFSRKRWGYCTHSSPSRSRQSNMISSEKRLPIQWIILEISEQLSMLIKLALQQEFELADYQQSFGEVFLSPHSVWRLPKSRPIWPGSLLPSNCSSFQWSCSWSTQLSNQKHVIITSAYFFPIIGICDTVWELL